MDATPKLSPEEAERRAAQVLARASAASGRKEKPKAMSEADAIMMAARAGGKQPSKPRSNGGILGIVVALMVLLIGIVVMPGATKIAAVGTAIAVYLLFSVMTLTREMQELRGQLAQTTDELEQARSSLQKDVQNMQDQLNRTLNRGAVDLK
jgi:cobalamin biosynthesis protein CobD/CbiB